MQFVAMIDFLVRMEIEPAIVAGVPGYRQCLKAAFRKLQQVLLKRRIAEDIFDEIIRRFPVGAFGIDHIAAVAPEEPGRRAIGVESGVVKIRAYALCARFLHGKRMM